MWKFEVFEARDGWRWRLKAANGATVATSGERFDNRSNAERAAENVKANAGDAAVILGQVDGPGIAAMLMRPCR